MTTTKFAVHTTNQRNAKWNNKISYKFSVYSVTNLNVVNKIRLEVGNVVLARGWWDGNKKWNTVGHVVWTILEQVSSDYAMRRIWSLPSNQ